MVIGLTAVDPDVYDRKTKPSEMPNTWVMNTLGGTLYQDGRMIGRSETWKTLLGHDYKLKDDDKVSLRLCQDRSISIRLNQKLITNIFKDIPTVPMWVILETTVMRMAIEQTSMYQPTM